LGTRWRGEARPAAPVGHGGVGHDGALWRPRKPSEEGLAAGGWRGVPTAWGRPAVPYVAAFRGPVR
jgi:hypothetical protein